MHIVCLYLHVYMQMYHASSKILKRNGVIFRACRFFITSYMKCIYICIYMCVWEKGFRGALFYVKLDNKMTIFVLCTQIEPKYTKLRVYRG